jgi:hypothetical protein
MRRSASTPTLSSADEACALEVYVATRALQCKLPHVPEALKDGLLRDIGCQHYYTVSAQCKPVNLAPSCSSLCSRMIRSMPEPAASYTGDPTPARRDSDIFGLRAGRRTGHRIHTSTRESVGVGPQASCAAGGAGAKGHAWRSAGSGGASWTCQAQLCSQGCT